MVAFHFSLSPQQLETLTRIRRARKHGFLPSLNDCHTSIAHGRLRLDYFSRVLSQVSISLGKA
jgi:hypothetical protein